MDSYICLEDYRIFDKRNIFFHKKFVARLNNRIFRHITSHPNYALVVGRQGQAVGGALWNLLICSKSLIDQNCFRRGGGTVIPLYLYPMEAKNGQKSLGMNVTPWPTGTCGRTPNLDFRYVKKLSKALGLEFISDGRGDLKKTFGPEDVFKYTYGTFHSQSYRMRYAEFLKRDFPRVPITSKLELFKGLCGLGGELVALHLMESDKLNDHITTFPVFSDNAVTKVGEKGKTLTDVKDGKGKLFINKTQYFDNLPEEVWNFHIGGYQVCYKWLYDRKKAGRKLSKEDIEHYHKIVVALNETIKIMKQIDEVIDAHGGWPIE